MIKKAGFYLMSVFYLAAGLNHFLNPNFYLPLIPPFFRFLEFINYTSGVLEMAFGVLLVLPKTRKVGIFWIITLLVLFIPSHVYFIQIGSCAAGSLCVSPWIAYLRLLIIHPLLILWAWIYK